MNSISVDGYRKLKDMNLKFHPSMNIITGKNAVGKTSLIEAIWLCSGCRSFRGSKDKDFINFDERTASIILEFEDSFRPQKIEFYVDRENIKDKKILLNGVKLPYMSRLFGNLKCVVFTPDDLELAKGAPDKRRNFLDLAVSQIKPSYLSALNRYHSALEQRNAHLKNMAFNNNFTTMDILNSWDGVAKAGAYISVLRQMYCEELNEYTSKIYSNLTDGKKTLSSYSSTVYDELSGKYDYHNNELYGGYLKKLYYSHNSDIKVGFTQYGIHRDDISIQVNDVSLRDYGSQGQKKSAAICLKLAGADILVKETDESPVILLDDVLSELDCDRQRFLINSLGDFQVFVTSCELSAIKGVCEEMNAEIFNIGVSDFMD